MSKQSNLFVLRNTGNQEWYTPPHIVAAAREVMGGIDLDPASCELANENVRAKRFYTLADDGLSQPWKGRVWLNPPYSSGVIDRFIGYLLDSYDVVEWVTLTNNATDTAWGQRLLSRAIRVCLPSGRVRFLSEQGRPGGPLQGQMICYYGPNEAEFRRVFSRFGVVR